MRILIFLFLLLPFLCFSQKQEELFIQQLVNDQYISESEAKWISSDSTLVSLYDVYLARVGRKRGERRRLLPSSWSYARPENYIFRLKLFIKHLREFNLIDKEICSKLYRKIKYTEAFHLKNKSKSGYSSYNAEGLMETEYEVMQYIYEWSIREKNKAQIPLYAKKLEKLGLIEDAAKVDIDKLGNKIDLLRYFKKCLYIKGEEFPKDICEAYKYAYEKLASLHPDFVVSAFKCEEKHVVEEDYESDRVYVSFLHQERQLDDYFYYEKEKSVSSLYNGTVSDQILFVFNLTLINSNAPYRAIEVENLKNGDFAVILVTKVQAEFLGVHNRENDYRYFDPNFYKVQIRLYKEFEYLTRDSIKHYLLVFDSLNLFRGLSQMIKDSIFGEIQNSYIESAEDLFYSTCQNQLYFDWEMWSLDAPYVTATKEFASVTAGDFSPTNIRDNFNIKNEYCDYEFTFNGKRYAKRLAVGGDWFDPAFLELIEQAMEENDLPGKFYDLTDGGQASGHVYLNPVQYQYLLKHKLITFWRDPFED